MKTKTVPKTLDLLCLQNIILKRTCADGFSVGVLVMSQNPVNCLPRQHFWAPQARSNITTESS